MQMPLVLVSIQIGLFTTTRSTMHTPLVRVTILHQFFHQNCLDKLAIHHGNDPHASDFLNRFLQHDGFEKFALDNANATRASGSSKTVFPTKLV